MHEWRCLFEATDGTVLTSQDAFDTAEEAAVWGNRMFEAPDLFTLEDPDGFAVSAQDADVDAGFTIESDDGETVDPDELDL